MSIRLKEIVVDIGILHFDISVAAESVPESGRILAYLEELEEKLYDFSHLRFHAMDSKESGSFILAFLVDIGWIHYEISLENEYPLRADILAQVETIENKLWNSYYPETIEEIKLTKDMKYTLLNGVKGSLQTEGMWDCVEGDIKCVRRGEYEPATCFSPTHPTRFWRRSDVVRKVIPLEKIEMWKQLIGEVPPCSP